MKPSDALSRLNFIDASEPETAVTHILADWRDSREASVVHYLYYASFIALRKDRAFADALALGRFVLIDGIGMQLWFKAVLNSWPNNLNGTDLNPVFIRKLAETGIPVAFFGTTEANIREAKRRLSAGLDDNAIYYIQDGFSELDWSAIRNDSALFVGMGSPRQEKWVAGHIDVIREKRLLVITVGGFFDFASGFYIRAPKAVRTLKLEWAWRTMLHPKRHLKKRLRDLTILYLPFIDRIRKMGRHIRIEDVDGVPGS